MWYEILEQQMESKKMVVWETELQSCAERILVLRNMFVDYYRKYP